MDGLHSPIYASDRVRRYRLVHLVSLTLQLQKNELMNFEGSFFYYKTIEKCLKKTLHHVHVPTKNRKFV